MNEKSSEKLDGEMNENSGENFWIIDRFEEDKAVLENAANQEILVIPKASLPCGVREGTMMVRSEDMQFVPDHKKTEERSSKIKDRFERLKKKR